MATFETAVVALVGGVAASMFVVGAAVMGPSAARFAINGVKRLLA